MDIRLTVRRRVAHHSSCTPLHFDNSTPRSGEHLAVSFKGPYALPLFLSRCGTFFLPLDRPTFVIHSSLRAYPFLVLYLLLTVFGSSPKDFLSSFYSFES